MLKYILMGILVFCAVVAIGIAVPLLALGSQQPVAAAAQKPYLYTLMTHEKENNIITSLADGRLVRIQLVLELDGDRAPKDPKKPDRDLLVLHDTLLHTLRSFRSTDLEPQNQAGFKQAIMASAARVLGKQAVHGVYIGSIAFQ